MRRIIQAVCIVSILATPLHAQDFIIGSGSEFHLGGATLELHGNWINEGTFVSDTGTIAFVGQDSSQYINADHEQVFYHLTVDKETGDVLLTSDITVNGTLDIVNGDIDLNENDMSLGTTAEVKEKPGNKIKGTGGDISVSGDLDAPLNLNIGGLGAVISSNANFGATTVTRGHVPQAGSGNTSILRYYDISTTVKSGLNATLVLHYDDSELNGIPESELQYLRSTDGGTTWIAMGGVVDPVNNTITLTGIDAFSMWSMGTSEPPEIAGIESSALYVDRPHAGIPITTATTITDADDIELEQAFITITGNYDRSDDRLIYRSDLGISGSWNALSGTLTLNGTATIEEYQEALRNVLFFYTADSSTPFERTISISVSDGTRTSNILSRTVLITVIGDPMLRLTSPNGGEITEPGSAVTITWEHEALDTGKLEYSMNDGVTWQSIATVNLTHGTYNWIVPGGATESCIVRITSLDQPEHTDTSDALFSVAGTSPITISENLVFVEAGKDSIRLAVSFETDDGHDNIELASYIAWNDTASNIPMFYGPLDTDHDGDIDAISGSLDSVTVGTIVLPSDTDSLTVGITAVIIDGAYYAVDLEQQFKLQPDPPSNLTVVAETDDAYSVSWECSTDDGMVTGYRIYRSTSDDWNTAELVATVAPGINTFEGQPLAESLGYYWVQADSPFRDSECGPFRFDPTVIVSDDQPTGFVLLGSYPNPFNPTTTIAYTLPDQSHVRLAVYSTAGQMVRSYDLGILPGGQHEFVFDAAGLPSGMYLYRLQTGNAAKTGRMMLMK